MTIDGVNHAIPPVHAASGANKPLSLEKAAQPSAPGQRTFEDIEDSIDLASLSPEAEKALFLYGQQGKKYHLTIDDDYKAFLEDISDLEGDDYLKAMLDKALEGTGLKAEIFDFEDRPLETQKEFLEQDRRWIEGNLRSEYEKERSTYHETKHQQVLEIDDRLLRKAGGLLYGVSYSYAGGDYSKPHNIRTSSGDPHPRAHEIGAFLRKYAAEIKEISRLLTEANDFMPFEEWKAKRGQPYADGDKQLYDRLMKREAEVKRREAG